MLQYSTNNCYICIYYQCYTNCFDPQTGFLKILLTLSLQTLGFNFCEDTTCITDNKCLSVNSDPLGVLFLS
jgi:hypothetical protein